MRGARVKAAARGRAGGMVGGAGIDTLPFRRAGR
jgi:hypothetical protein